MTGSITLTARYELIDDGGDEGDSEFVDTSSDKSNVTVDKGDDAADDATDDDTEAGDIEQTGVSAVGVTAGFAAVVSAIGAAVTKLFGRRK